MAAKRRSSFVSSDSEGEGELPATTWTTPLKRSSQESARGQAWNTAPDSSEDDAKPVTATASAKAVASRAPPSRRLSSQLSPSSTSGESGAEPLPGRRRMGGARLSTPNVGDAAVASVSSTAVPQPGGGYANGRRASGMYIPPTTSTAEPQVGSGSVEVRRLSKELGKVSATNTELTRRLSNQEGEKRRAQLEAIKLRQKMENLEVEMEETEQSWSHEQHRWKENWEDEKALVEQKTFEWIPMRREDERASLQRHVHREVNSIRATLIEQGAALFQCTRDAAERNAELEEEVKRLKAALEAPPPDVVEELERHKTEHQALSERYRTLEATLTSKHLAERQALSKEVAGLRDERIALEELKEKACREARVASNAEHLMADLAAEAERKLKEEHRRVEASHADVAAEVDELRDELRQMQAKLHTQDSLMREMEAQLSDARRDQRKHEKAAAAAKEECQQMKELMGGADGICKVQQREIVVADVNGPGAALEHTDNVSPLNALGKQVRFLGDLRCSQGDASVHKQMNAMRALGGQDVHGRFRLRPQSYERTNDMELIAAPLDAAGSPKEQLREAAGDGNAVVGGPGAAVKGAGASALKPRGGSGPHPEVDGSMSSLSVLSKQVRFLIDVRCSQGEISTPEQMKAVKALERQVGKLENANKEWAAVLVQRGMASQEWAASLAAGGASGETSIASSDLTEVLQLMGARVDSLHSRLRGAASQRRRSG